MQSVLLTLWCVLVVALMPIFCVAIAKWSGFGKPRREGGYDNHDPRDWLAKQAGYKKRAIAAQANCFEALPFFLGALLLALHMNAQIATVNAWVLAFVALRFVYVALYLADKPWWRSAVWMVAMGVNMALLFAGA